MKRLTTICTLCLALLTAQAQTETETGVNADIRTEGVKDFDGFLLDMNALFGTGMADQPVWDLGILNLPADYPRGTRISPEAISFQPRVTFTKDTPASFHLYGPGSHNLQWQGASYRLKNGIRINTYGEYDADGYKRTNPAALPWQRNRFNAAFEVKSANGNFGIKVEVSGGGY